MIDKCRKLFPYILAPYLNNRLTFEGPMRHARLRPSPAAGCRSRVFRSVARYRATDRKTLERQPAAGDGRSRACRIGPSKVRRLFKYGARIYGNSFRHLSIMRLVCYLQGCVLVIKAGKLNKNPIVIYRSNGVLYGTR